VAEGKPLKLGGLKVGHGKIPNCRFLVVLPPPLSVVRPPPPRRN